MQCSLVIRGFIICGSFTERICSELRGKPVLGLINQFHQMKMMRGLVLEEFYCCEKVFMKTHSILCLLKNHFEIRVLQLIRDPWIPIL